MVKRLELSRHAGFIHTSIQIDKDNSIESYLQRLEDKINELIQEKNAKKNRI